jgi:hypothetical protein
MDNMTKDIFHKIAERDAAEAVKAAKAALPKLAQWKVSLGNGRISYGHTYHSARKTAARYNRMFSTDAAYALR